MPDSLDQMLNPAPTSSWPPGSCSPKAHFGTPRATGCLWTCAPPSFTGLTPGGQAEVFRDNSGGLQRPDFRCPGRLVMCEGDNRQIARMEPGGGITPIAATWTANASTRPNDIVCHSNGSLYFTDPGGRLPAEERELDFFGVHRVSPDGSVTTATRRPNTPMAWGSHPTRASCTSPLPGGMMDALKRRFEGKFVPTR